MANVQDDLVSIIADGSLGWNNGNSITPSQIKALQDIKYDPAAEGGFLARLNHRSVIVHAAIYDDEALNAQFKHENRTWTLKVTIVGNTRTDLQGMFEEMKRVCRKYSQVQGTGFTTSGYDHILVFAFTDNSNYKGTKFVSDGNVQLVKPFQDVSV